jgi:hypothetical protein
VAGNADGYHRRNLPEWVPVWQNKSRNNAFGGRAQKHAPIGIPSDTETKQPEAAEEYAYFFLQHCCKDLDLGRN